MSDVLFPANAPIITVKGEKVDIKLFPFGKLPVITSAIGHILDQVGTLPEEVIQAFTSRDDEMSNEDFIAMMSRRPEILTFVINLFETCHFDVMQLMAVAVRKDIEWVADLDPDKAIEIVFAVAMVNYDFFTKRFKPLFSKLMTETKIMIDRSKLASANQ